MSDALLCILEDKKESIKKLVEKYKKFVSVEIINSIKKEIEFIEEVVKLENEFLKHEKFVERYLTKDVDFLNSCVSYKTQMQTSLEKSSEVLEFHDDFLERVKTNIIMYREQGDYEIAEKIRIFYSKQFLDKNIIV